MSTNYTIEETPYLSRFDPNFRSDLYTNRFLLRKHYESDLLNKGADELSFKQSQQSPIPDSVVHLNRYEKNYREKEVGEIRRKIFAKVLRDFRAVRDNELSVQKGDIVIIRRQIDFNWVEVEDCQSGLIGFVPRRYLDSEQEGLAKVKFTFIAKNPGEISLTKGDTVKITRKIDENWYEGQNIFGTNGIFPCAYVELVKNPLAKELELDELARATTPIFRTLSPTNLSPQPCKITRNSPYSQNRSKSAFDDNLTPHTPHTYGSSSQIIPPPRRERIYNVLYPYKPQKADELELIPSDSIIVTLDCGDGWVFGKSMLRGNYGLCPGNYLERVY